MMRRPRFWRGFYVGVFAWGVVDGVVFTTDSTILGIIMILLFLVWALQYVRSRPNTW